MSSLGEEKKVRLNISLPPALLWDYREPPDREWAIQRIAEFFPVYGHDRQTVEVLYSQIDSLNIPDETREAIRLYYRIWQEIDLRIRQRQILEAIANSELAGRFYFGGGSALALFDLKHRVRLCGMKSKILWI